MDETLRLWIRTIQRVSQAGLSVPGDRVTTVRQATDNPLRALVVRYTQLAPCDRGAGESSRPWTVTR